MDHVKKLVYTIVGCLTIVSLTFTICTKIGHCAESSDSPVPYEPMPFLFGENIGDYNSFSQSYYSQLIDLCITDYISQGHTYSNQTVLITPYENVIYVGILTGNTSLITPPYLSGSLTVYYSYCIAVTRGTTTLNGRYDRPNGSGTLVFPLSSVYENINGSNYYKNGFIVYPVYVYKWESLKMNGDIVFVPVSNQEEEPPFSGHTKGGVLGNYIDSQDMLEDNSEVHKVDKTPPADSSSIPGWLQKILNGLGTINGSIQSGVLTIGDYIGQLKESIENAIAWITETPDSDKILDNVEPYLAENDLISGFLSSKTAIQGVYGSIGNVTAKTRSQMVWDIPFNLPSMSQTFHARIDFGWYENIRSTIEPFLNMFLCVTFLFSFLRSIPGILHGNSGEGDT